MKLWRKAVVVGKYPLEFSSFDKLVKSLSCIKRWLSKNTDKQGVVVFQVRRHTCGMSSAGKSSTTQ